MPRKKGSRNKRSNSVGTGPFGNAVFGNENPWGSQEVNRKDTLYVNLRNNLISNDRNLLSQCYVEIGLIKTIVDIPVEDAMRGGIEITTEHLSADELKDLQASIRRQNDLGVMTQALKWKRLFGGAGIIVLDGNPVQEPIDLNSVSNDSELEFIAADMWELYQNRLVITKNLNQMNKTEENTKLDYDQKAYTYYGQRVHSSRVIKLKGEEAPNWLNQMLRGWGLSVVESLITSINQYLKANNLAFEVLDEYKLDIFKIKGMTSTLLKGDVGVLQIQKRLALANRQKNYKNALAMDAEDEFDSKQLSFTGIAEAMTGIRSQVASDMRIPQTKLFGQSAAGFSSGEDDIENYNAMIEAQIRSKVEFDILKMVEYRCMQKFGMIPDDLTVSFQPLRVLSSLDQENIKNSKFARLLQAKQAGEITTKEFKESCNKGKLFDTSIDTTIDTLDIEPDEPEQDLEQPGDSNETNPMMNERKK